MPSHAVSAPGKVLLAGGFLILDRQHTGLVFALNARIHCHIQTLPTSAGVVLQEIVVRSPQFHDATWRYGYHLADDGGGVIVTQLSGGSLVEARRNPFVETALTYALTYAYAVTGDARFAPAVITILADDDYYSDQRLSQRHGRFTDFGIPLWEAHKTGLGSSAALVTSFAAAVLLQYAPSPPDVSEGTRLQRMHNLAQAAHSAAQGKVGSGFDVASAVYGSCVYRRFSPAILEAIGEHGQAGFVDRLKAIVNDDFGKLKWDTEVVKSAVAIPRGLRIVMCDVDCGSQTPGMVRQVLAWRKEHPQPAAQLWGDLQARNEALAQALVDYDAGSGRLDTIRSRIQDVRRLVQEESRQTKVPIEPAVLTGLLDGCSAVEGVVGGVTPGAGGYDAVALLIEDSREVVERLEAFLASWRPTDGAGDAQIGRVRLLQVSAEMAGLRVEQDDGYRGWSDLPL